MAPDGGATWPPCTVDATIDQLCKMFAGCLWCNVGDSGEFSRREHNPSDQAQQHRRSGPVAQKDSGRRETIALVG